MHTNTPPHWHDFFQAVGRTFRRPYDEKYDPKRPKYITGWSNRASGFLMVSQMKKLYGFYLLEVKTHFEFGFLNFETRVSAGELALLANIPHPDIPKNDIETAREHNADFYIPGVCLRCGDEVVILLPDKHRILYGASIQLKSTFTRDMKRMLEFGRVDVKSGTEA